MSRKKKAGCRDDSGKSERPGTKLVRKTAAEILSDPTDRERFVELYQQPAELPTAVIRCRDTGALPFKLESRLSWQPGFVERVACGERPGAEQAHADGEYYCLDMSSVFMAAPLALLSMPPAAPLIIDLCASPGGKSVFAWRALGPELLISNEVIGKRLPALISNLERCGAAPSVVTRRDPSWWAEIAGQGADVVIVDAPCSGQSLPFRGIEALGAFHPSVIGKSSLRQRRIVINAAELVRPGGFLLYTTCTFARRENEGVIEWLLHQKPNFAPVPISQFESFQSALTELPMYRLLPQTGIGAGGFTVLLQREGDEPRRKFDFEPIRRI